MTEWSCLRLFSAFRISFVMLGLGGTAFWSTLFTVLRTVSVCSASSGLMVVSTFAIISVVLMLVGVTAKFSPFLSRVVSASLSVLEDRLMTQFAWSTLGVEVKFLEYLFLPLLGVTTGRPHRLKKNCSTQSKRCVPHQVTSSWDNRTNLYYQVVKGFLFFLFSWWWRFKT